MKDDSWGIRGKLTTGTRGREAFFPWGGNNGLGYFISLQRREGGMILLLYKTKTWGKEKVRGRIFPQYSPGNLL